MLEIEVNNNIEVVVCHNCKTIFSQGDGSIVTLFKCSNCDSYYYLNNGCECKVSDNKDIILSEDVTSNIKVKTDE
jgi:hypothetical protein